MADNAETPDIVERLQAEEHCTCYFDSNGQDTHEHTCIRCEAAALIRQQEAEIERLRAALAADWTPRNAADEERVRELIVSWREEGDGANLGRLIAQVSDLVANVRAARTEECARVAEQKVKRLKFTKPGGEVEVHRWRDGPEIAAAMRALER